jgi:hypothetical protein
LGLFFANLLGLLVCNTSFESSFQAGSFCPICCVKSHFLEELANLASKYQGEVCCDLGPFLTRVFFGGRLEVSDLVPEIGLYCVLNDVLPKRVDFVLLNQTLLGDTDDEEKDEENELELALAAAWGVEIPREVYHVRDRMVWEDPVAELLKEGPKAFQHMYRMTLVSFTKLCSPLDPFLVVNREMSEVRTDKGIISTEIVVASFLRWAGGGSYLDLRTSSGISTATFYIIIQKCVNAIMACEELAYYLPNTLEKQEEADIGFQSISTNKAVVGCVACLDGFLLRIKVPSTNDVGNVTSFFPDIIKHTVLTFKQPAIIYVVLWRYA